MSDYLSSFSDEYIPTKEQSDSNILSNINCNNLTESIKEEYEKRMEEIRPILVIIEKPLDLTDSSFRQAVFPKLSFGLRKAGELESYLLYYYKMSVDALKRAKAVAFLEEFEAYAKTKELKFTDKSREFYIPLNEKVQKAQEIEAILEAYLVNIKTIKQEIIMAMSTIKGMVYGIKDYDLLSSSAS